MTALLAVAQMGPKQVPYIEYFVRLWNYVKTYVIDDRHGGWFASGLDSNPEARRWPKATMWRDASHEVAALLECKQILDTLPVGNETDTNVY
jgi:mannobiose 2-epimerase